MNYPSTIPAPQPPTRRGGCDVELHEGEALPVSKRAVLCGSCAEGLEERAAAVEVLEYE